MEKNHVLSNTSPFSSYLFFLAGATTALTLLTTLAVRRKSQNLKRKRSPHPSEHHSDWNVVDESSWESFPASDPPGHY